MRQKKQIRPISLFPRQMLLAALVSCALPAHAQAAPRPITLVLSGGGARGLAQIGVLKAFDEAGIKPDVIVATSMGAVIGSLYSAGYVPDSIAAFARAQNWEEVYYNASQRNQLLVSRKDQAANFLMELRFDRAFNIVWPNSLSYGQAFYDFLTPKLATTQYRSSGSFQKLPIPIRIVATDVVSGRRVVLSNGNLVTAIRASCGFPLVFSPVASGPALLMDGGMSANIPVEPAKEEFPDNFIIAVDVTSSLWSKDDLSNPVRLVDQIVSIGMTKQKAWAKQLAHVTITPALAGYRNTDFNRIDSLIAIGYREAKLSINKINDARASMPRPNTPLVAVDKSAPETLPAAMQWKLAKGGERAGERTRNLQGILKTFSVKNGENVSEARARLHDTLCVVLNRHGYPFSRVSFSPINDSVAAVSIDFGSIKDILIEGNTITSPKVVLSAIHLMVGDTLRAGSVSLAISDLYALDLFKNVTMEFDSMQTLHISLEEKEYWRARMGLRMDEFHRGEGFLEPAYTNIFGSGISALLHLQYGLRREAYVFELSGNNISSPMLAQKLQFQAYISREIIRKASETPDPNDTSHTRNILTVDEQGLRKAGVMLLAGTEIGKTAMIDGGIRIERFRRTVSEQSVFTDPFTYFEKGVPYLLARAVIDNLDKFPFPKKGQKHYFSIGGIHDIIGGEKSFLKIEASSSQYYTIAGKHTFFPQVQLMWATDSLPDAEKAYVGGAMPEEKHREIGVYNYLPFSGLVPRALPGDIALILHCNYRLMLRHALYLTCVVDWGYAWTWNRQWAWDTKSSATVHALSKEFFNKAPVGIGIGIAYESIVGPMRLSWGRLLRNHFPAEQGILSENHFYCSVGHDF